MNITDALAIYASYHINVDETGPHRRTVAFDRAVYKSATEVIHEAATLAIGQLNAERIAVEPEPPNLIGDARQKAETLLAGYTMAKSLSHEMEELIASVAAAIQNAFDLGNKAAGGAVMDKPPHMGGLLEIAMTQAEIDAVCLAVDMAKNAEPDNPLHPLLAEPLNAFLEKVGMFRSKS